MSRVEVVHWNPRDARFPGVLGQLLSRAPRKNNFGDLLGPLIVGLVRGETPGRERGPLTWRRSRHRLLCVGSILHFAHDGDTIWGAGVNGKFSAQDHSFRSLDVRAVRGPMTRDFLLRKGVEVPEVYGDPGLLLPHVWNGLREMSEQKRFTLAVVPNLNEIDKYEGHPDLVNPRDPFDQVIQRIAQSERVVGSSLHAIVVAESLGIPASLIHADVEAPFKYDDYYLGTGRTSHQDFPDLCSALTAKVHEPDLEWDAAALLATFPWDLWNDERGA